MSYRDSSSRYSDRDSHRDSSSRYSDRDRHRSSRDSRSSRYDEDRRRSSNRDYDERREGRDSHGSSKRGEERDYRHTSRHDDRDRSARGAGRDWDSGRDGRGSGGGRMGGPPGRMGNGYGGSGDRGSHSGAGGANHVPVASSRRRSRSPESRPKEPTPPLDDVVPILERKRRQTMWDKKPPGYDAVTAEQAKMSGLFPLPGAPRTATAPDQEKLDAFAKKGSLITKPADLQPTTSRQARRMVVSNLPPLVEEAGLISFFNSLTYGLNVGEEGKSSVLSAQINKEKGYAILELRASEVATLLLGFDGVPFNENTLQIRRPQDYIVPESTDDAAGNTTNGGDSTTISSIVPDSPHKILIKGLPVELTDEQIQELLSSFGTLKAFVLIKDRASGESKGFAFCEYSDSSATDIAVEGLNGMELGEQPLVVQRASIGLSQVAPEGTGLQAISALAEKNTTEGAATRVLVMFNMVTADELNDATEYEEICEDIKEECTKFGEVVDIKVPRPLGGSRVNPGVGKVFVRFVEGGACTRALKTLAGRKFADRTVLTSYYPEENYEVDAF